MAYLQGIILTGHAISAVLGCIKVEEGVVGGDQCSSHSPVNQPEGDNAYTRATDGKQQTAPHSPKSSTSSSSRLHRETRERHSQGTTTTTEVPGNLWCP